MLAALWCPLDQHTVDAPGINAFKRRQDKVNKLRQTMWDLYGMSSTPHDGLLFYGATQGKLQGNVKPCPHCRSAVWLSPNSATVAVFCDSLTFVRQSHFSATVWTGLKMCVVCVCTCMLRRDAAAVNLDSELRRLRRCVTDAEAKYDSLTQVCFTSFLYLSDKWWNI